jgi:hypothetical protein
MPNQIELKVVVNGQPVVVKANVEAPVNTIIEHALAQSGNSGQPITNWELRDASGQVLDPARKIEDYNLQSGATLFLNLKAGIGG